MENNHTYDWWYFPFQLCSVPMYLGLLLPAANSVPRLRSVFTVFIQDYGLLGGIMALLEPSGLIAPLLADDDSRVFVALYPDLYGTFLRFFRQ
mgnify:CR=1 FL=1